MLPTFKTTDTNVPDVGTPSMASTRPVCLLLGPRRLPIVPGHGMAALCSHQQGLALHGLKVAEISFNALPPCSLPTLAAWAGLPTTTTTIMAFGSASPRHPEVRRRSSPSICRVAAVVSDLLRRRPNDGPASPHLPITHVATLPT